MHLPDQRTDVGGHRGPVRPSRPRSPGPVQREPAPVPAHDGIGRDDLDGASPVRSEPRQQHPQQAIGATETRPLRPLALEDGELMPESENLRLELETRPNGRPEGGEQRDKQRGHATANGSSPGPVLQRSQQVPNFW